MKKKKPRRVSNLGLLANTRTRSKNDDGFDDPQQNEAAERRRRNRVSRFGWWCERNREREGEKRGAAQVLGFREKIWWQWWY